MAVVVLNFLERAAIDECLLSLQAWSLFALISQHRDRTEFDAFNRAPGLALPLVDLDTVKTSVLERFQEEVLPVCA